MFIFCLAHNFSFLKKNPPLLYFECKLRCYPDFAIAVHDLKKGKQMSQLCVFSVIMTNCSCTQTPHDYNSVITTGNDSFSKHCVQRRVR